MAEVAGAKTRLRRLAQSAQAGELSTRRWFPRADLKRGTGSCKTLVRAMLIAGQTLHEGPVAAWPRFTKRFPTLTPGTTIRDRLCAVRLKTPRTATT